MTHGLRIVDFILEHTLSTSYDRGKRGQEVEVKIKFINKVNLKHFTVRQYNIKVMYFTER